MDERETKLNKKKELILLKLGGGLLTDKSKPLSLREAVVKSTVEQIINANKQMILIHGGGSFGHPLAKKYSVSQGINPSIPNQIFGFAETHHAMNKLNSYLVNFFLEKEYPTLSIQPSSIFIKDFHNYSLNSIDIIEAALDLKVMPILYGDVVLDKQGSFTIISGDQIIIELCKNLKKYSVSKVIFATETDGIFINAADNKGNHIKLVDEISFEELDGLDLADLGHKIDVTGGIQGKIESIKELGRFNIPVQILNGLEEGNILKSLTNKKITSTYIKIK